MRYWTTADDRQRGDVNNTSTDHRQGLVEQATEARAFLRTCRYGRAELLRDPGAGRLTWPAMSCPSTVGPSMPIRLLPRAPAYCESAARRGAETKCQKHGRSLDIEGIQKVEALEVALGGVIRTEARFRERGELPEDRNE